VIIVGIDPGLSGAIAVIGVAGRMDVYDIPTFDLVRNGKKKREVDIYALARLPCWDNIDYAWLEQVGAMPGQGVSSVFSFGQTYGIIKGILAARQVPFDTVTPRVWKAALHVPAAKDGARARASQLMPGAADRWARAKDDGRAEAALIAYYGAQQMTPKEEWT
jgi:crossover junction endodeoxyribonuclease RuvC